MTVAGKKNRRLLTDVLFVLIILFLIFASILSYQRISTQNAASTLVAHANFVKYKLGETISMLREAEKKEQDSIRTEENAFTNGLLKDSSYAFSMMRELDSLTAADSGQHPKIIRLHSILQKWVDNLQEEHRLAKRKSVDLSSHAATGQLLIDSVRNLFIDMRHTEDEILLQKMQEKDRSALLIPLYSLIFSLAGILLITGSWFRLRSESRLRQKAEDGQTIIHDFFQQVPASLAILTGPQYVFEFANPSYRELIGGKNPVGKPLKDVLPEIEGQGFFELLDSVYHTGKPFIGKELPVDLDRGKGLERVHLNFIYQALRNTAGNSKGILVFAYDVSDMVHARRQVEESENRSRLAIEAAHLGTFDWDLQNQQFFSSARLIEIFGYHDDGSVTHQDLLERFHPDDKPLRDQAVTNSFTTGSLNYEVRVIWPDHSVHWINVHGKIFTDDKKNILRMYGTALDTTEKILVLEEMEKMVLERTQSLNHANLSLKQTIQDLENSNAELASFNYIASHDLQEPLRKIIAFSKRIEDLDRQHLSESSIDYFKRIIQAASRMQNLIDAFLSYSQTDGHHLLPEPVDLNKVLADVKMDLADTIERKNVKIENETLPVVLGIGLQIHQLFINLIGNSMKYSRSGVEPSIRIFAEKVTGDLINETDADKNRIFWHITVMDNGIGFDQAYQTQIFELFQRLHSRHAFEGTGIGLAICKKIMRNHKGFITAKGVTDAGATFSVYFPFSSPA